MKRYRYTGKERDEETGLYYHGARYYIPWLARWSAVDPLQGEMPEWSPYNYGFCNPITFNDPTGTVPGEGDDPQPPVMLVKTEVETVPDTELQQRQLILPSQQGNAAVDALSVNMYMPCTFRARYMGIPR